MATEQSFGELADGFPHDLPLLLSTFLLEITIRESQFGVAPLAARAIGGGAFPVVEVFPEAFV